MTTIDKGLLQSLDPHLPSYNTGDKSSFAYKSALERWPVIITQVIDDLYRTVNSLTDQDDKIKEGQQIIEAVAKLKYDETHDRPLEPLNSDGGADIDQYNQELSTLANPSWFNAPWLFSECYLYRRMRILFTTSTHWTSYDPFSRSKDSTFKSSGTAVQELAVRYQKLVQEFAKTSYADSSDEAKELLFIEMSQISLWGNATDLSLLTSLSYEDLQKLQGAEAIKASQKNILANDLDQAWKVVKECKNARIDIVLDNAGFELFADLILATYLLETKHAETIVLHPKDFAWFVSDVTPNDVAHLFSSLSDPSYFPNVTDKAALEHLTERWMQHYIDGSIMIRPNSFWTTAHPFTRLPTFAPSLLEDLQHSQLVIFKGDLNYRKLVGDATWPVTTSFEEALGSFAHKGVKILALRTCKADVIVGITAQQQDTLDAEFGRLAWRTNGKYAVVSFHDGR